MVARSLAMSVCTRGRAAATHSVVSASRKMVAGSSLRHGRPPATEASTSTFVYRTA